MKQYYVYILHCHDDSLYVGLTNNIQRRIEEHQSGLHPESYTYSRRPVELVFYGSFTNVNDAINKEKQIKRWSRAKKQALIDGKMKDLINLSKKKFKK